MKGILNEVLNPQNDFRSAKGDNTNKKTFVRQWEITSLVSQKSYFSIQKLQWPLVLRSLWIGRPWRIPMRNTKRLTKYAEDLNFLSFRLIWASYSLIIIWIKNKTKIIYIRLSHLHKDSKNPEFYVMNDSDKDYQNSI